MNLCLPSMMQRSSRLILLLGILACAQAAVCQAPLAYPDSAEGLQKLVEQLHAAARHNDSEAFRLIAEPLLFTEHEAWFKDVFGERYGTYASDSYKARSRQFVNVMRETFRTLERQGLTRPEIEKIDDPCRSHALTVEYPVLFARIKTVPLYSLRYKKKKGTFTTLGFFIYADRGFRYVGNVALGPIPKPGTPKPVNVGPNIQVKKLVHKPQPQYPEQARKARIQGTVRLEAMVGVDGSVRSLSLLSGHCWLAEAAIAAVRQWRYTPTLENGVPVEVTTTIDIIFTLSS